MRRTAFWVGASFAAAISLAQPASAQNDIGSQLLAASMDPFGISKGATTLAIAADRTMTQLNALVPVVSGEMAARIEQSKQAVLEIMRQAVAGSKEVIDQATSKILEIEKQVMGDARELLFRARCAGQDFLVEARVTALTLVNDVHRAKPSIEFLGITIVRGRVNKIEITHPDDAYRSLRRERLQLLSETVTEKSSAYDIISAYGNLQRMARLTLCSYIDQPIGETYIREIAELNILAAPWASVVAPRL